MEVFTNDDDSLFTYEAVTYEVGDVNVMERATVSQSSLYLDGEAYRAIDGNKS